MYRFGSKTIQVSDDDQPKREVEQILGRKNKKNGLHYFVKWKGFQSEHASWVPLPKLQKFIELVKQYQRKLKPQNELNIDMQFADNLDGQRPKKRKRKVFQQDLIFKKIPIKSIKKQQIKQQKTKKEIKKRTKKQPKKQIKRQKKQNKTQWQNLTNNSFYLAQSSVNLSLQVSQVQGRAQNKLKLKQIQKNNQQGNPNQSQQNQQNDQEQFNQQSQHIQNESSEYQSLNLSQYQNQQDQKIALGHLNPDQKKQNTQKIKQKQKKLLRIQTPLKQLKLLDLKDVGQNSKISKIVKSEGIWLVQLKGQANEGQTNGYISVDLYKEIDMSNLLEYLHSTS